MPLLAAMSARSIVSGRSRTKAELLGPVIALLVLWGEKYKIDLCPSDPMNTQKNLIAKHFGLRGIALFEAAKGLGALVVGIWLLTLLHKDMESVAAHLLHFLHKVLHLSPDGHI